MEQGVGYSLRLSPGVSAALRLDGWFSEHPPELLGRSTQSWFSALPCVCAVMVQLWSRTRWALDFPPYPKWGSKPHGKKPRDSYSCSSALQHRERTLRPWSPGKQQPHGETLQKGQVVFLLGGGGGKES